MFESNNGAELPVISTINNLVHTGDKIVGIDAVVSESLNFIINEFNEGAFFAEAVKLAIDQGFTESDPEIDLNGMDVLRKLLVLCREAKYNSEIEDVNHFPMILDFCLHGQTPEDLLNDLKANNGYFENWRLPLKEKKIRYGYIASIRNGKASIGLKEVKLDHPFYNIHGKDNVISLSAKWYDAQPLIIKGAGAEIAASGIFGDIIRICSN